MLQLCYKSADLLQLLKFESIIKLKEHSEVDAQGNLNVCGENSGEQGAVS